MYVKTLADQLPGPLDEMIHNKHQGLIRGHQLKMSFFLACIDRAAVSKRPTILCRKKPLTLDTIDPVILWHPGAICYRSYLLPKYYSL